MHRWNGVLLLALLPGVLWPAGGQLLAEAKPAAGVRSVTESPADLVRGQARAALARLAGDRGEDSLRVSWPENRLVPRRVFGMDWSTQGTAREVASRFATEFADLLGVAPKDLAWTRDEKSTGRTAVRFRQEWNGIPVKSGNVVIVVADSGKVLSCNSGVSPVLVPPPDGDVGADAARTAAVASLGNAAELGNAAPVVTGKLVIAAPDRAQIVYRVLLPTIPGVAKLVVLVDAATGNVVQTINDVRR